MYFYKHGVSARPLSGYMVNVCVACVLLKAKKTSLSESMLLMWAIVQMIAYFFNCLRSGIRCVATAI